MTQKSSTSLASCSLDVDNNTLLCQGAWDLAGIPGLNQRLPNFKRLQTNQVIIDVARISALDTSGVWQLQKLIAQLQKQNINATLLGLNPEQQNLFTLVSKQLKQVKPEQPTKPLAGLALLGKNSLQEGQELLKYFAFIGELTFVASRMWQRTKRFHWRYLLNILESTGFHALPIIALLSFMIGVVLTYQMGIQLRTYGADIYIVDLLGTSVLREFGPLLTAIIIAGRSGSAYTAQLGTMKLNEEIDALTTMGLVPMELLTMPRLIGLVIALPLLTIWANFFGVFGGMVMAKSMLHINFHAFLMRFQQQVSLTSLLIGLGKAPVFALLIASIGCFQGMQVKGGAESVGQRTTKSVVQAIFMIIVTDAVFSIIFSKMNL